MEIIYSHDLDIDVQEKPIISKDGSIIYKSCKGELIKIYTNNILKEHGKDLVKKLSYPGTIDGVVSPNKLVYVHSGLIGYTMDNIKGKNDIDYENDLDPDKKNDLYRIADKYRKLEKIVKNAPEEVVFPGLLDRESIINSDNEELYIVGYDNLQIGQRKSLKRSSDLGDSIEFIKKYYDGERYTKELDIRSLITYYIQLTFGLNINDGYDNRELKTALGGSYLEKDILEKILLIHDPEEKNVYLGDDVVRIASNYKLVDNKKTKKLVPKWME